MNKIIQFDKIGRSHPIAGAGFGSNLHILLTIINHLSLDDNVYVDMETVPCVCTEKNFNKFNTSNCWEYYYDQIPFPKDAEIISTLATKKSHPELFTTPHFEYKNVGLLDYSNLQNKFNKFFKLKDYIKDELDLYYNNILKEKVTLGVHIRLTDMLYHHQNYYPTKDPMKDYINKIKSILKENPNINQIFIATDDNRTIETICQNVNVPVVFHQAFRADDDTNENYIWDRMEDNREFHKYNLSLECIKEIYTLGMCNYFLRAPVSAISNAALFLNSNINKLYQL